MAVFRNVRTVLAGRPGLRHMATALLAAAALSACTPIIRNHGYVPTQDELALVEIGVDTRETVGQKIGRPSTSGLLNDEGWYYVQSQYRVVGPREPKEIERQVLVVTFNEAGTVENIAKFGLEDGKVVEISRRVTETNIKGITVIQQLLGSFGQIRAEDVTG
ncbi:MAG: outer membrane protein assembly factor BamE [Rhodobacterales bacterium]|nr:outer membrane protein assembly factor BamE [Rhodobacterales bacterium]